MQLCFRCYFFFKRPSDVHDDKLEQALREFDDDEEAAFSPENYRFQIPEHANWQNVLQCIQRETAQQELVSYVFPIGERKLRLTASSWQQERACNPSIRMDGYFIAKAVTAAK